MPQVGYLWLPHLAVQVARRAQPDLGDRPLVVGGTATDRGRVLDASPDCLADGVRMGMRLREAAELVPAAAFVAPDGGAAAELLERTLDHLDRFSALVEDAAEGAWFLPAAPAPGVAEERRLAVSIVDGLAASLGLETRLALAPGKAVARLAAERERDPVTIIPDGAAASYLAPLPVGLLPLAPRALERLRLLNVTTIGQFARLPADNLSRRFGKEAPLAHAIAQAREDTPLVPRKRPEVRFLGRSFERSIEDRTILGNVATDLLRRLCLRLQAERRAARSLRLILVLDDGRVVERRANLRAPTNDAAACRPVLMELVEGTRIARGVDALELRFGAIGPEVVQQGSLFDDGQSNGRGRLEDALDEVSRRHPRSIRRVTPGDDPGSLLEEQRLLLLPYEPDGLPAPLEGAEPALRARPVRLRGRGERVFLGIGGPDGRGWEEIVVVHARWEAAAWWPRPQRRTYYRVRTCAGLVLILARDQIGQRWLLVSRFD